MEENYFIAYIIIPKEIPEKGIDMLFFYTKKGDEYYWGTGNNSFDQKFMDELESKNKIIKLPELIKLVDKKSLWVDALGKVYFEKIIGNIDDDYFKLNNLKCLEGIILDKKS